MQLTRFPLAGLLVPILVAFSLLGGNAFNKRTNDFFRNDLHHIPHPLQPSLSPENRSNNTTFSNVSLNELSLMAQPVNRTSKSYFVLHVGPPKTATTTLQLELQNLSSVLQERDNVLNFYPDKNPVPLIATLHNSNCHVKLKQVREQQEALNSTKHELRQALNNVTCWKPFLQEIQKYRQKYTQYDKFHVFVRKLWNSLVETNRLDFTSRDACVCKCRFGRGHYLSSLL